jgi:iron complex outermembrane receptor protein
VNGQQVAFKDISGGKLPGVSDWAGTLGGEFITPAVFLGNSTRFFIGVDASFRSDFSSSASPSAFLNVEGYTLVNARVGYRVASGLSAFIWSRNLFNKDYHEQLLVAGGNAGQYASVLGDPRTWGITVRYGF